MSAKKTNIERARFDQQFQATRPVYYNKTAFNSNIFLDKNNVKTRLMFNHTRLPS